MTRDSPMHRDSQLAAPKAKYGPHSVTAASTHEGSTPNQSIQSINNERKETRSGKGRQVQTTIRHHRTVMSAESTAQEPSTQEAPPLPVALPVPPPSTSTSSDGVAPAAAPAKPPASEATPEQVENMKQVQKEVATMTDGSVDRLIEESKKRMKGPQLELVRRVYFSLAAQTRLATRENSCSRMGHFLSSFVNILTRYI